jgi:enamine deaminase RidA (YjgF/YER057c/UK114 family)
MSNQPRRISSGSSFEEAYGYGRAVVDGDYVFVSGCTGFDYRTMTLADGPQGQCRQAIANVEAALADAGATLADTVRVQYIVRAREDFFACQEILAAAFGDIRPAATMWVAELLDPEAVFEIQVTARFSNQGRRA